MHELTDPAKDKVNGEESYICPFCGHGKNGDGMTRNPKSADGNGLICFGCDFRGDVIDLYRTMNSCGYNDALRSLAQLIGIDLDPYTPTHNRSTPADDFGHPLNWDLTPQTAPELPQNGRDAAEGSYTAPTAKTSQSDAQPQKRADYTEYYKQCVERLNDPAARDYLASRGISVETAAAYWIGYDPFADPAQSGRPAPGMIMPTSTGHYVCRRIDPSTPKQYRKMNNKGGTAALFNSQALYAQGVQEVFVVEGIFDALSIIEAGAAAISLNSTSNAEKLIKQLEQQRTDATLILCLDNDEAGQKAADTLRHGLQRLNICYISADICSGRKDPNEALTADRQGFIEAVDEARRRTAARPDNTSYYIDRLMTGEIERFKGDKNTGFANLDALAGGLYSGLYVVAAISSLGKTSFCLQLADQLAAAGNDVLFFSLEQSRLELVSKSLARLTYQNDPGKAVSSLSIRKGYLPGQVLQAADQYKAMTAERMNVIEGNMACNITFIGDYIRQYMKRNDTRPVIFIDYLQILQPATDGSTKKQGVKETVDATITELKRISRELDLTVFIISSVNRTNYLTPIDFESLKESGGIEYTADVIWGLQLQCLNEDLFDKKENVKMKRARIKEAKAENPRRLELVCLKNRYGISSYSCYFNYYPAADYFEPSTGELDFDGEPPRRAGRKL